MIGGRHLRWLGAALLVAGLIVVYRDFPTRPPESWQPVHGFHLDGGECLELRRQRQTVDFEIPDEAGAQVTVAEVAEKFHLELPLVCAANERPDCGQQALTAGADRLRLPLSRRPEAEEEP